MSGAPRTRLWAVLALTALSVACGRSNTEPASRAAPAAPKARVEQALSDATCMGVVPTTIAAGWKVEPLQSVGGPPVQASFMASVGERALIVVQETSGAAGSGFSATTRLNGLASASLTAATPLAAQLVDLSASNVLELEVTGTGAARASVASLAPLTCTVADARASHRGGRLPTASTSPIAWPPGAGQGVLLVESGGHRVSGRVSVGSQPVASPNGSQTLVVIVSPESSDTLTVQVSGDAGDWIQARLMNPDMLPPLVSMTLPSEGQQLSYSPVLVQGQAVGAATVKVGEVAASLQQESYSASVPLQEGSNALVVAARDACGNVARVCRLVQLSPQPPIITIHGVSDGQLARGPLFPLWEVVSNGPATVSATLDGVACTNGTPVSAPGAHLLVVTARDQAGRQSQESRSFVLDTAPPSITVTGVEEGERRNTSVVLGFSVEDEHPGTVQATLDGAPVTSGAVVTAEGTHELVVVATDAVGNQAEARRHFTLDLTPPVLAVLSPAPGAYVQAGTVEVVVSATDEGPVASVLLGASELVRGEDGNYRGSVALEEGSNLLVVQALDGAGNSAQSTLQLTRDSTPPQLSLTTPDEGAKVAGDSVQVEGHVEDATPLSMLVAGQAAAVEADGHFLLTVAVAQGPVSLEVVATDAAGNLTRLRRPFRANSTPPRLDLSAPPSGTLTEQPSIQVSGFARAVDRTDTVKLEVAGGEHAVGADGHFSVDVPLEPGSNTITVTAVDGYGLRTPRSVRVERLGSTDGGSGGGAPDAGSEPPDAGTPTSDGGNPEEPAPTLVLSSPEDDSLWATERVPVLGRVQGGTLPLEVTVDGLPAAVVGRQFSASLALPEGSRLLTVRAVDARGRGTEERRLVKVDRTPPFLDVSRPEAPLSTVTESPYLVEGSAGDAYLSGVTVNGGPVPVVAGRFSMAVRLVAGDNTVEVEATDLAGNRTHVSRTLRVDGLPPQVTVLEPLEGSEAGQPVVRVSAKVEASAPLAEVRIGTGLATESSAGVYTAQVALALGENTLTISARDTLGLTGTATVHVRYRDPSTEPLVVTGVDPADQAENLEPDTLVNVAFNKPVQVASARAGFTVSLDGQPLPGGWSVAPGGQTVSFIARDPLPESATLQVRVAGVEPVQGPGMQGEFRSTFKVRRPLTRLRGAVVDEHHEPLAGVRVEVEGQHVFARTGADGNWALFDVAPGPVVLRYEGPVSSEGQGYPTLRRPFAVAAEQDNVDALLALTPVDAASAETVDTSRPVQLTFAGHHGALELDIPAGGMIFADGTVRGTVTATEVSPALAPVRPEGTVGPAVLWQLQPSGTRLMAPVEMRLPNRTQAPPGHQAVIFTYDPDGHLLRMAALATVSADGSQWVADEPVEAASLEFFGFLPLPEETAGNLAHLRPLHQGLLGLDLTPLLEGLFPPVIVTGAVRGPTEQGVALTLGEPSLDTERQVALTPERRFVMPISFKARGLVDLPPSQQRGPLTASIRGTGPTGQTLGPPSGQPQWWNESADGKLVELSSSVELEPGTSLLTLAARGSPGADSLSLSAELTPSGEGPSDGGTDWRLRVRRVTEDGGTGNWDAGTWDGLVRFRDMPVSLSCAWFESGGMTNAKGVYAASIPCTNSNFLPVSSVRTCVQMPLGNRVQSWVEGSGDEYTVKTRIIPTVLPECSLSVEAFTGDFLSSNIVSGVNVTIDARWLYGSLTFVNREGVPLSPSCETERDPDGGVVTSLSEDDIRSTEIHFFLEGDLSQPIASYTVGHPTPCEEQQAGKPQGEYSRIRLGPSALLSLGSGYRGRNTQRLVAGDRLVVFGINHATGYAGMNTITVPPINQSTRDADGRCPEDETEGPLVVDEGGRKVQISHCTLQSLGIRADLQLYPPEIDVRVERRAQAEGVGGSMAPSLVRHGGAATTRDEFVKVSTQWRVRRQPASPWQPRWLDPYGGECDGGVKADGGTCAPQGLYDEGLQARLLERYCGELTPPLTPEQQQECLKDDSKLADVPEGVPPLAGRVVRITGSAAEEPAVAQFKVKPGRGSATVQTAMRVRDSNGQAVTLNNLSRANYYVQVVGHAVLPRDRNNDGTVDPSEENAPPPDFSDEASLPGLPQHAVHLKNVYRSLETDGGYKVERYDLAREHEFQVVEVKQAQVTARTDVGADGGTRTLPNATAAASPEDLGYEFLLSLLEPPDPGRAGTLSGEYALRLGSDSFGMECPIEVDAASGKLRGTCEGDYLPEVLSASDIVYLEVYLRGNAENVLYRFNFDGLSMREDYVGAASRYTSKRAVEETDGKPVLDRPISQLNEANFFLTPQTFRSGRVRLCTAPDCGNGTVIKDAQLKWALDDQGTWKYLPDGAESGRATATLVQDDTPGANDARHFRLALPASLTRMPGEDETLDPAKIYLVTDAELPVRDHFVEGLGAPRGRFQGLHAEAPGQQSVAGIGLASLSLAFTHTDFSVPQYAETVSFSRTYLNQNDLLSPLGLGWRHGYDGFVWEEQLGRYVVVLGNQSWGFNACDTVDRENQTASGCQTDKTHGMELEVRTTGVQLTTEYGHVYRFDRPAVKGDKEGRRKWLLTKFHDGHGRGEEEGWTHLTYASNSNRLTKAQRTPGSLTLEFKYCADFSQEDCDGIPEDASGMIKALARREGFKLLEGVILERGETPLHVVRFKHDRWGNLLEAERTTDPPAQRWKYQYAPVPSNVAGQKAGRAVNELAEARFEVDGSTQWRATYERGGAQCYEHLEPFECVTGVKQTGSMGQSLEVQGSPTARTVTLPEGVLASMGLNDYGNTLSAKLGSQPARTLTWPSTQRGGEVRLDTDQSPTGRTLKYRADSRMRVEGMRAPGASDVVGLSGELIAVTSRTAKGLPSAGTISTAAGTASWTMPRSESGDVKGLSIVNSSGTVSLFTRDMDPDGRITSETDALGNTTTYAFENPLGIVSKATVSTLAVGGLGGYELELGYDDFGRLTSRRNEATGEEETWTYDGQGNVRRHSRAGQPAEVWTYDFTYGDQTLTVVEHLQGVSYSRTSLFQEGLLVSETLDYGQGSATRTYRYEGGRLTAKTDERGVVWSYTYDDAGRLQLINANGKLSEKYELDADGNVKALTDREGRRIQIGYDSLGQPISWLYEDGHLEQVKRDAQGAIVWRKSASAGVTVPHVFEQKVDALGRVLRTSSAGESAGGVDREATYDAAGRVLTRKDSKLGLDESFEYKDALGRLTRYARTIQTRDGPLTSQEVRSYADGGGRTEVQIAVTIDTGGGQRIERRKQVLDALGRLLEEDQLGKGTVTFTYDARGDVLTRSHAVLGTSTYTYDGLGHLLTRTEPGNVVTTYTTDAAGLVLTQQGPHEQEQWTFGYDDFSRPMSRVIAAAGSTPAASWGFEYLGGGKVQETNPIGSKITRSFNSREQLISEKQGARTTDYAYDGPWPRQRKVVEGGWELTQKREFDDLGRARAEEELWTGGNSSYTYQTATSWDGRTAARQETWQSSGAPTQSRSASLQMDSLGNLVSVAQGGLQDTWLYDAQGALLREALAGRPEKRFTYEQGRLTRVDEGAEATQYTHDGAGRVETETDPAGRVRTLHYDAQGLLAQESFGKGGETLTTDYTYDRGGFPRSMMRGGVQWGFTHGPRGELQSVVMPGGLGSFVYQYDALVRLTGITPPGGGGSAPQTFAYDEFNRRTRRTRGPSVWTTTWENGTGSTTDPNGDITERVYDGRGRVAREKYLPGGQSGPYTDLTAVSYAYDGLDQRLAVQETRNSGPVSIGYGYDARSRLTSLQRGTEIVTYTRTDSGQKQSVTSPSGTVSYQYDAQDRVEHIESTQGASVGVTWEPGGLLKELNGNGVVEQFAYYGHGLVRSITSTRDANPLTRYEYSYDDRGNRMEERYKGPTSTEFEVSQYGYDLADRLTGVRYPSGEAELYALHGDGSRREEKLVESYFGALGPDGFDLAMNPTQHWRYSYDPTGGLERIDDLLSNGIEAQVATDAGGRVISEVRGGTTRQYGWDAAGRLASIKRLSAEQTVEASYTYDADGLRRSRSVGDVGTHYAWGASEDLLEEEAATGPGVLYARADVELVAAAGGERLLHDALGSIVGRAGATANLSRYGVWGDLRQGETPGGASSTLAYAGQYLDSDAGLNYARQRWYDPRIGRFLSEDPVGAWAYLSIPTELNPALYARGNPATLKDPDGRATVAELIDRNAEEAASRGGGATLYGWAFLGVTWKYLGAESVSRVTNSYLSGEDIKGEDAFWAGVEVATAGKGKWIAKALSVGGRGIARVGQRISQALRVRPPAAVNVWALRPFERGVAIENAIGRNLPGNFPVIDRFINGIATSIKSLDLGAKAYQNAAKLRRTVTRYIDDVAAFTGRTWGGATVSGAAITGRELELAIPAAGGTAAQHAVLQALVKYGQTVGVTVKIIPF